MKAQAVIFGLCVALAVPAASSADNTKSAPAWEKFGEEDGISVYRREIPGSPIIALRGEGVVNANILRVASVLVDTTRATEWVDSLAEVKIIRQISETERVQWNHIATPVVLKDRDFVFRIKLEGLPKEKKIVIKFHSVEDPAAPKTDYIRGKFIYGTFVMTSIDNGKKTRVLTELMADPKGSVAKWIVNMFQKSWPHKTIASLRKQVAKPDIKDHPRLKEELKKQGIL